jgi:hypothetical protein
MKTSITVLSSIVAASLCTGLLVLSASAQMAVDDPSKPLKPGAMRVTTKAPEPDKWLGQRSANGMERSFKCKELACPDATTVTISFAKSPTRHPDPQALVSRRSRR